VDEQAFLTAIAAAPDDEALRLVYADWLEENGRAERGELIRVQVALADPPEDLAEYRARGRGRRHCWPATARSGSAP
jgi:uncharacterized protein (TIGR02996 family)